MTRTAARRVTIAVGALALVVGAMALVVLVPQGLRLLGTGPRPADVLPASTFALASVDLDPPLEQKLAVRQLAKRLPKGNGSDEKELLAQLATAALRGSCVDFGRDVAPWLGKRVGLAAVRGGVLLGALSVRDSRLAHRSLARLVLCAQGGIGLGWSHGYAIVGTSQAGVDAAVDEARRTPLGADGTFRADMRGVGAGALASLWADGRPAAQAMLGRLHPHGVLGAVRTLLVERGFDRVQGRLVAAVRARSDGLELQARLIAAGRPGTSGSTGSTQLGRVRAGGCLTLALSPGANANRPLAGLRTQLRSQLSGPLLRLLGLGYQERPLAAGSVVVTIGALDRARQPYALMDLTGAPPAGDVQAQGVADLSACGPLLRQLLPGRLGSLPLRWVAVLVERQGQATLLRVRLIVAAQR